MAGSKGNAPFSIGSKPIVSTCPLTPYIKEDNTFSYYPSFTSYYESYNRIQTQKSYHQHRTFLSLLSKKMAQSTAFEADTF